jgi:hypothetical protein
VGEWEEWEWEVFKSLRPSMKKNPFFFQRWKNYHAPTALNVRRHVDQQTISGPEIATNQSNILSLALNLYCNSTRYFPKSQDFPRPIHGKKQTN